jgi:hypothetical protein
MSWTARAGITVCSAVGAHAYDAVGGKLNEHAP